MHTELSQKHIHRPKADNQRAQRGKSHPLRICVHMSCILERGIKHDLLTNLSFCCPQIHGQYWSSLMDMRLSENICSRLYDLSHVQSLWKPCEQSLILLSTKLNPCFCVCLFCTHVTFKMRDVIYDVILLYNISEIHKHNWYWHECTSLWSNDHKT